MRRDLRSAARGWSRWCADIIMMAATVAFTFQGTFIAQSGAGATSHYHHGFAQRYAAHQHAKSHVVAHVHADGTVHQHAVKEGDKALKDHLQEPGCPCCWNMAIVAAVLPLQPVAALDATPASRVAIAKLDPYRSTEPDGPRRPPRTPSIA
jgi:hypothetical protein